MKRSVFLICVILMCLLAACGTQTADPQTEPETTVKVTDPPEEELAGYFKLSDYENKIIKPSEENFGPITDVETLVKKTETLWVEIFGEKVKDEKPYQVYFDKESGAWYVHGIFHNPKGNKKGGVHHILVDHETGDVLAVWGDK